MLYGFFSSHSGIFKDSNVSCSKTGKQIQKYNFSLFNEMCYRIYYSVVLSYCTKLLSDKALKNKYVNQINLDLDLFYHDM